MPAAAVTEEVPPRADERTIRLGHSPDPDDAFMHYAVTHGKVDTRGLTFVEVHRDIETLNHLASKGVLEATAVSMHAYGHLVDTYQLLPHGASMGEGYGPIVVAKRPMTARGLARTVIAIPGTMTSAFLELRMAIGQFEYDIVPFDQITKLVKNNTFEAGLLIHEGQITYAQAGLRNVFDIYNWWADETGGLPLPLGGNAVRRDLGASTIRDVSLALRESILWALEPENRAAALDHALTFGRGVDRTTADRFVGMYVNPRTLDYGEDGRRAVQLLMDMAAERGFLPRPVLIDFVDDGWRPL